MGRDPRSTVVLMDIAAGRNTVVTERISIVASAKYCYAAVNMKFPRIRPSLPDWESCVCTGLGAGLGMGWSLPLTAVGILAWKVRSDEGQ